MEFLATKIFGVFLASSLATVSPIILFGKGPPYEWVKYKTFWNSWGGQWSLTQYKTSSGGDDWHKAFDDCKVAVLWKYFNEAFLFRCDGYREYWIYYLTGERQQEEKFHNEVYQYVKDVMWPIDKVEGYLFKNGETLSKKNEKV